MRIMSAVVMALSLASPVSAHHSDVGLDMDAPITVEGIVKQLSWRNPHIYLTVETTDADGAPLEWRVQMTSIAQLTRRGWSRDTLRPGDRVSIETYPALNGRPYGLFKAISRSDGSPLVAAAGSDGYSRSAAGVAARATSLAGNWISDEATVRRFPARMDGMFARQAKLTDRGRAAQSSYIENSADNPQLRCLTRPAPAMIVYTDLYPLQIDFDNAARTVTMRSGYFDAVRVAYLDGRDHPPASERFYEGHAVGHWEGDTLVIDSRNFEDYHSPQSGIPFGAQKHVVERYTLAEDGRRMTVEFVLEDPEHLAVPVTHRRELIYAPDAETPTFDCDPSSTTGFVEGHQMEDN